MKVSVRDFQSLRHVELQVEGLTVVVGKSNLGKSALIRALEGVLFNRSGNAFVRVGANRTEVTLEGVSPALSMVVWRKGPTTNQYEVNGKTYGRVGSSTPDALQEAGFRDVWVDTAQKVSIRPQVADQFDPLFLLSSSPAHVADVMNLISRLSVIQRASDACASDLRKVKQSLGVHRSDLESARVAFQILEPVPTLVAQVEELEQGLVALKGLESRIVSTRKYLAERKGWVGKAQLVVPAEITPVPDEIEEFADRVRQVRTLVAERDRASTAAALTMPEVLDSEHIMGRVSQFVDHFREVRRLVGERQGAKRDLDRAASALRAARQESEQVEAELARFMAEMRVCPVCERPL